MNFKRIPWLWIIICALVVLVVFVGWKQYAESSMHSGVMTKQEAKTLIQERFQGEISTIKLNNHQYYIELKKQKSIYLIKLDYKSGMVLSIESKTPATPAKPDKPTDQLPEDEPSTRITDTEAIEIAQNHVKGVVDHLSLETENEQTFYLVEIETPDDKEAIVQIHAITGEIMSVTWDDHDDLEDDDDD